MKVHHEALSDVSRYIESHRSQTLDDKRPQFDAYMRVLRRFVGVDRGTRILEIGTGTGWFPILCKLEGVNCTGLEINPRLIEFAREYGRSHGIEPDIVLGNLEDTDIGAASYDIIVASSVFEHVELWKDGVAKVHRALKPGGAMYFESTNKFSFFSGEYGLPLYGWLPNRLRYAVRIVGQGRDIMKLGIDFHQFTHGMLRREFERIGFTKVLDRIDMAQDEWISSEFRKRVVRVARKSRLAKALALTFADATRFLCFK
jgi:SAM-dependent methyltransferase